MAEIIDNKKGFKIICSSMSETWKFGGMGICESCNKASFKGYIICVLNRWYCEKCYEEWDEKSIYYSEDSAFENQKFEYLKKTLKII